MSNLTSFDWWLATYLVAAGFGYAFYTGQLIVKLLLIRFASHKRIDDGLWRLGSLLETHYGELKENETITIQAKRFTAIITRTPEQKVSLIKKIATERVTEIQVFTYLSIMYKIHLFSLRRDCLNVKYNCKRRYVPGSSLRSQTPAGSVSSLVTEMGHTERV